MTTFIFAFVVIKCYNIKPNNLRTSEGKVIFGDVVVAKRFDQTELVQIPKTMLGEGMLGTLFKVVLECGSIVTVRKIREGPPDRERRRCSRDVDHFWNGGETFILYEYLILGSLVSSYTCMHTDSIHTIELGNEEKDVIDATENDRQKKPWSCRAGAEKYSSLENVHAKIQCLHLWDFVIETNHSITNLRGDINERKVKEGLNCVYDKKMRICIFERSCLNLK
ncbi:hypothetical protein GQ457_04G002430 [Hibiscus cannabinus]